MNIAIAVICLLLALVFYLSIEVKQQKIALKQLQEKKEDSIDTLPNKINQDVISKQLIASSSEILLLYSAYAKAPVPVLIHAEDGEILQVNQVWTEITGYSIKEIPTIAEWTEKAYGKRKGIARAVIDRLYSLDRRVDEGEFAITTASGQVRIWDFSSAPLGGLLDGRRLVVSIAKDITETKQAQKALQQTEDRFRNTFEQAAVGIAHVAPDGRWLKVNQKLCQIVGYTREELLQKTFQDITYPEDLKPDLENVRKTLSGEINNYSMEKRYLRKDGSIVWIDLTVSLARKSNQEPDYFISVVEDISDRKKLELAEKQLIKRLANLHQIDKAILEAQQPEAIANIAIRGIQKVLNSQCISLVISFEKERETAIVFTTPNRADLNTIKKIEADPSLWQNLIEQLDNLDCDKELYVTDYLSNYPQLSEVIPTFKVARLNYFLAFPLKTGDRLLGIFKVWFANKTNIPPEELETIGEVCDQIAIALQQAYLSRKIKNYALELENKVAQRTAQLEDINRELKAFTYSISHDLKAPLRAIQGFATALQEDYGQHLDELGQEYASRLNFSARQMEHLIQDLLSYSRLSRTEIQMRSVSLDRVVTSAMEQLATEIAESGAKITVDKPLLDMFGNQTVLTQIVFNLLSNAIKFVAADVKPAIRIWTESKGNCVRLWVADNGLGIEPQYQERIFRVFERLHGSESYPGTGIGLAIVKKGMERLGGKFGLESKLDCGSRFWIENHR